MKYRSGVDMKIIRNRRINQFIFFSILISIGIVGRIFTEISISNGGIVLFDMFALISLLSLTSGYVSSKKFTYLVPLAIMFFSDSFLYFTGIGNGISSMAIILVTFFVWSGFLIITFLGKFVSKKTEKSSFILYAGAGIWGSLIYDSWTNFGFWLGPFYPHTLEGLALCYFMAIPFILGHLITTIALLPPFYLLSKWGKEVIFREDLEDKESKSLNFSFFPEE